MALVIENFLYTITDIPKNLELIDISIDLQLSKNSFSFFQIPKNLNSLRCEKYNTPLNAKQI